MFGVGIPIKSGNYFLYFNVLDGCEPFYKVLFYSLTDLQGRQLLQGNIQNQETMLDISHLSKGIYLLNISDTQGNKWNKKIVKGE